MELKENNLVFEGTKKVIATFDFSNESGEVKDGNNIEEMRQSEFSFTDGLEENIACNNIEEIEMLKDEEVIHEKTLAAQENEKYEIGSNFKEYIKLCRELGLIASWMDFEEFNKFKN